jgi:hypothetical protein
MQVSGYLVNGVMGGRLVSLDSLDGQPNTGCYSLATGY